ncbi:uncharacterized protein [Argopecten irradians]|uniref:uncharacterized protein n=1 Tax=Argopecten irradians TaxID=31199 RepID=UPI003718D1FC
MEDIPIPNTQKIASLVTTTIDRFTDMAKAISVTEEGRTCVQNISKVSVCRKIMIELNSTKTDFDGLLDVLQNVILIVLEDGSHGCCQSRHKKLLNLTAAQKKALQPTVTFDKLLLKELGDQEKSLQQLIQKHKKVMADFEKYRRETTKHQNKLAHIIYQLHNSGPMKKTMLLFLQMRRDYVTKDLIRAKNACRATAEQEMEIRTQIRQTSKDLERVVADKIHNRLQYGMEDYMYDTISKIRDSTLRKKAVELIRHMNIRLMSNRLVDLCSDIYVMKTTSIAHLEPNSNADLALEDVASESGSSANLSSSASESVGNDPDSATDDVNKSNNQNEEVKTSQLLCRGDICKVLRSCPGDEAYRVRMGISSRLVRKTSVRVTKIAEKKTPGFIDTRSGMNIKQTAMMDEINVGFGYHRRMKLGAKRWGFFFIKPTN